jgi:hypothetical protein
MTQMGYEEGIFNVVNVQATEHGLTCRIVGQEHTDAPPSGKRGDRFARSGDESLPCLKAHYRHGDDYHDPYFYDRAKRKEARYVDAIRRGRVLIRTYLTSGSDVVPR